jgi:hypothetical protein
MNRNTTQDRLADQLAIAILLEAFGPLSMTAQACDLAAEAVLATDAIEGGMEDLPAVRNREAAR